MANTVQNKSGVKQNLKIKMGNFWVVLLAHSPDLMLNAVELHCKESKGSYQKGYHFNPQEIAMFEFSITLRKRFFFCHLVNISQPAR